jgi:hypothetical protein
MKEKDTHLMFYDFSNQKFVKSRGFGKEISVLSDGQPITVFENGELAYKHGSEILKLGVSAKAVSSTRSDDIWIVSEEKVEGGFQVYKAKLSPQIEWENMGIGAVRVSGFSDTVALIVNEWGEVYTTRK